MTLIAHMADIHLGYRQYNLVEREEDVYVAFEEMVEKIIEEHARYVLIAGDFFDSPRPTVRAVYHARWAFRKLAEKGIRTYCVLGDHDKPRRVGEYAPTILIDELVHIQDKNVVIEEGDRRIAITGMDKVTPTYADAALQELSRLSEESKDLAGKRILLMHLPMKGTGELSLDSLPSGYTYYALGHEHVRRVLRIGNSTAAYPGSIEIFSRSEAQEWQERGKGFYLVDLSGPEPQLHSINISSIRPQRTFSIMYEQLDQAIESIGEWAARQAKKPIIHLLVRGRGIDRGKITTSLMKLREALLLYRFEIQEEIKELGELDASRQIDVKELIREILRGRGLSPEEIDFAVMIYDEFLSGGGEAVESLLMSRAPGNT